MSEPPVEIRQIYFSEGSERNLDAGFIPLDNRANPKPDWREYDPIRRFLLEHGNGLDEAGHYGFFSHRFAQKTFLDAATVHAFIREDRNADVIAFSPGFDLQALFLNTFLQGEYEHPELIATTTKFLQALGMETDLRQLVMDWRHTIFANYFVAKPAFWRAWLQVNEKLYMFAERPSPLRAELNAPTQYAGVQLKVFIMERIASLLLATDSRWKSRVFDPFRLSVSVVQPFCNEAKLAAICDALKFAYREHGFPTYLRRYFEQLSAHAIPQGRPESPP